METSLKIAIKNNGCDYIQKQRIGGKPTTTR
jgi:hypothetical protein